jgi:hypothetical protein
MLLRHAALLWSQYVPKDPKNLDNDWEFRKLDRALLDAAIAYARACYQ